MKRLLFLIIIATVYSFAVAQTRTTPGTKTNAKDVPSAATNSFNKTNPAATEVTWYATNEGYAAEVKDANGVMTWVMYDKKGNPTGTAIAIPENKAPVEVTAYLTKTYPGNKTTEIYEVKAADGSRTYMVLEDGKWITVDSKGNKVPNK